MRSGSARNFDITDLKEVAKRCHEKNVKCYLTLNTLVYNHELERVDKILDAIKQAGVDAIIVTDFGVIQKAREKGIECHISTQASIANIDAAKFYAQFSPRLVLAREVTLAQTKKMKEELKEQGINVEFEVFVHGALCVAESGRCFMSQFHNRISANRGQCLQECRKEYRITDVEDPRREFILDNQFVMSPKDLCALPILDKLVLAGIDVFKIEGRAKGPEYVFKVTKVYKEALQAIEQGSFTKEKVAQWLEELTTVYNRGFTTNFLLGTPTNDSWAGIYGSKATTSKQRLGKILNYYAKKGIAEAVLEDVTLSVGDTIAVTGPTTGYVETTVKSLHDERGETTTAKKTIVSFPIACKVRKNDSLYKIVKRVRSKAEEIIDSYEVHEPFKTTPRGKPLRGVSPGTIMEDEENGRKNLPTRNK
jgi:putative protease